MADTSLAAPIEVTAVSKRYDDVTALDGVSLEVGAGEIFGLVGPNGAGKTTLIRTILDVIKPDSGTVKVFGRAFQRGDVDRIGYLPEERGLYTRQPVAAVLEYMGQLKGMTRQAAQAAALRWLERFGLGDAAAKKIDMLSKGNQQKVQIAATLIASPKVAILDEPLSGLDPVSARLANAVVREYAAEGHTVVLSTHQMNLVESLCARVFMIARGRRVLYGAVKDIRREHSGRLLAIRSSSDLRDCPLIEPPAAAANGDAVHVELKPSATAEELLEWLIAAGARIDSFERVSTPLEDIFVRLATESGRPQ